MTFEFDYNTDTDQITIVYDGACVLSSDFDGEKATFRNFEKIGDDEVESMLKNLCRAAYNVLA
jgi:predicted phosphoribosyltransferase